MKLLAVLLSTVFCCALAFWPEALMYGCYSLVNPQSDIAKIIMILGFWGLGAGLCVLMAFLGFALWVFLMQAITK